MLHRLFARALVFAGLCLVAVAAGAQDPPDAPPVAAPPSAPPTAPASEPDAAPVPEAPPAAGLKQIQPAPGAAWKRLPLPDGGRVTALVATPDTAVALCSQPFWSKDGTAWQASQGVKRGEVSLLAARGKEVFAASYSAVWQSSDGGKSFTALPAPTGKDKCGASLLVATAKSLVAWRYGCGMQRWTGGAWQEIKQGDGTVSPAAMAATTDRVLGLWGTQLFELVDGSDAWTLVGPLPPGQYTRLAAGGKLYAAVVGPDAVQVSPDSGKSWTFRALPQGGMPLAGASLASDGKALYVAAQQGFFQSADQGATWKALGPPPAQPMKNLAGIVPAGKRLLAATVAGVLRYDAKKNAWLPSSSGLQGVYASDIHPLADGLLVLTLDQGIVRCDAAGCAGVREGVGRLWAAPTGQAIAIAQPCNDNVCVLRSEDGGRTWNPAAEGGPDKTKTVFAVGGSWPTVYLSTSDAVHASTDGGRHFAQRYWSQGRTNSPERLAIVGKTLIAAAPSTGSSGRGALWRSADFGATFTAIPGTTGLVHGRVTGLTSNARQLFAALESKVVRATSYPDGLWSPAVEAQGLPPGARWDHIAARGNQVWVVGKSGVFQSDDDGTSFAPFALPPPVDQPRALAATDERLLLAAGYDGVWALLVAASTTSAEAYTLDPPQLVAAVAPNRPSSTPGTAALGVLGQLQTPPDLVLEAMGLRVKPPADGSMWTARKSQTRTGVAVDWLERVLPASPLVQIRFEPITGSSRCSLANFTKENPSARPLYDLGFLPYASGAVAVELVNASKHHVVACTRLRGRDVAVDVIVQNPPSLALGRPIVRTMLNAVDVARPRY